MEKFYKTGVQKVEIIGSEPIGTTANAWNASVVGANGNSTSVDKSGKSSVTAYGNASAATTISLWVSDNNVTFYNSGAQAVLAGAGDFHINVTTAARYVRLRSSAAATITATIIAQ